MASSVLRAGVVLAALATAAACVAPSDDDGAAAADSDLTFQVSKVDTSLPDVDAIGYDVTIRVDDVPKHETLTARVDATYVATRALTELSLDFDGNTVDAIHVGTHVAQFHRDGAKLVVALPSAVAKGATFTTRIEYHGDVLQADGQDANDLNAFGGFMVKQKNAEKRRIYTTLNWPHNGRRWLPLRDHPSDGAMFAISATFPKAFTVLANGKRTKKTDNSDGTTTWRYEALAPMPPYDFHLSAYDGWSSDDAQSASGIPITSYLYKAAHPHQAEVYSDVHAALDWYEQNLGTFRWGSLSYIEEPIFGGGMENASVVSMDETVFDDLKDARDIAFHELAHHWSGNLARVRTWNDFWLSEGFTEYEKARFVSDHDGPAAKKAVWRGYLKRALAAEASAKHAVRPPDPEIDVLTIFDDIPYEKGALCLRLVERIIGTEKLTTFLRGWFTRHEYEAVTTAQLEKELSAAAGVDLSKVFAAFVYGLGHPEISVTFVPNGATSVDVTVTQVQAAGPFPFPLDLDFVDAAGATERVAIDVAGAKTKKTVHVTKKPASVVVDPDEYLLGTVVCDDQTPCKTAFRCGKGTTEAQVCIPR